MAGFGFIIEGDDIFSAGVKPHLLLGKGLLELGHRVSYFVYSGSERVLDYLSNEMKEARISGRNDGSASQFFSEVNVDYVMTDDFKDRFSLLHGLKKSIGVKTIVYSHVFGGLISYFGAETGIPPTAGKPSARRNWVELSKHHKLNLKTSDYVISNSGYTESLNWLLFGVESDAVIYPPLDTGIFKLKERKHRNGDILIYSGNSLESAVRSENISKILCEDGYRVKIFGGNLGGTVKKKQMSGTVETLNVVSEKDLANLYSHSSLTVVATGWESYGNVGAESLACGTPVLAVSYQPWMENVNDFHVAGILRRGDNLPDVARGLIQAPFRLAKDASIRISSSTSISEGTERLLNLLNE
ncbi:MAG: glycosyltransferase [Thermoplasmataceae archaeon]